MRVDWAFPCREVMMDPDGAISATGIGASVFRYPLPHRLQFPFVIRVSFGSDELDRIGVFQSNVVDSSGRAVTELGESLVQFRPGPLPGCEPFVIEMLPYDFWVEAPGTYMIKLYVEGTEVYSVPIYVQSS